MRNSFELTANRLAWAGLTPFIATAVLGSFNLWSGLLLQAFLVYSAVILSFLGGIHWGLAMAGQFDRPEGKLVLCMAPALAAWLVVAFVPELIALPVLAACYLLWLNYDLTQVTAPWYERMRRPITFVVAGTHFIWFVVIMTALRTA
ncbi:DUF3429 domain-containing protein [Aliidiomarina quisquiliarum]|uniref:DUF3429 domain-containing protein n=1 Tax=Aliidiomarina quisquiliarum TaxID=2938947 RepID=UPI00208E6880|nr:DUF3429 domain-containing protein [Aliidiomarina quisquiliarum]MCO4321941.1 DUF3429 domain-containing protein [Aliidiomarina quisquiliarum]